MATEETPGSARKKKHRRAKSNLETQGDVSGSTDQLVSQESSRVLKARQRTQARFESFLQEAVAKDESFQETKKKKKKKRTHTSDAVLETIKYSSPITKGTSQSEENLLEANLYKEDDPSQEGKENKKSYKDLLEGSDQAALEAENADKKTPKKTKHKKTRTLTSEQNTPEDSKEKPRRRKKPKTPEPEVDGESAKENLGYENEATVEGEDTGEPSTTPAKKKGRKTRRRLLDPASADPVDAEKKRDDDGYILSATIHRADTLKPDICVSHPLVRVHLVDMNTGQYVKKSNRARSVTSYYENESDAPVDYIMPVMTQPFDFKKYKSLMPSWEEVLVFNEIFSYFLSPEESDPKVIMFFEVVDFLSMTATKRRKSVQPTGKGWYQVAWAFLKIVGGNGNPNTDKKVRLQLFQPPKSAFRTPNMVEVYQWWKQAKRVPYPSTLYVTLKGVQPPKSIDPSLRSMFAIQQEKGKITFEELALDAERRAHGMRDGKTDKEPTNWTRLPGQVNRIPNKQKASLQSGKRGCFVLKFSHNGRYLACGCAELDSFPVLIYEIPSYESRARLPGHFSIIYDLCWSPDDSELLSASSDGTVRSWDMKTMMTSSIKLFPHPCFVYAAQYHPVAPHVVVTGGYDHLVRVWTKLSEGLNGKLLREIEGHEGFINSICFDEQGAKMFSADSVGIVMVWNSFIHSQVDSKRKRKGTGGYVYDWGLFRKIAIDELQRNVINSLVLHPNGHKLLVHVRNSVLCMLDLRSYTIMQRFLGASNFKEHIRSTLSTCGSFVIAGSEDGRAYVWNTETGDLVSVYTSLGYYHAVSDVQFHPLDHIIAFCSFGDSHPVLLYQYDIKAAKEETKKLMTGPVTPSKHVTTSQESTAIPDDVTRHAHVTDVASDVLRMQRVKQRLDSVLETPASPQYLDTAMLRTPGADSMMFQTPGRPDSSLYTTPATSHPGKRPGSVTFQFPATPDSHGKTFRQGMGTNGSLSTWGSDFSPTAYTNYRPSSRGPSPAQGPTDRPMSPHAQQYFGASSRYESRQLFSQDMNGPHPYQTAPAGVSWMKRPSLSMSVNPGSPGPLSVTQLSGASPKPTFNFMDAPAASLLQQTPQPRRQVVAMYPYEANRADELTIQPGDIITVLLVDNENWSMGQLADGRQGYFPSNYVMEQEELESEGDLQETSVPTAMPVTKQQQPKTNTQMSAVISRSGDLKIVSGPEDSSDAESKLNTSARHRRRHRQQEKTETEERTEKKPSPRRTKKR